MMERFHEQFDAITTTLCLVNQNDLWLMADDKEIISTPLSALKPFLEATEDISGQEYVSVSLIMYHWQKCFSNTALDQDFHLVLWLFTLKMSSPVDFHQLRHIMGQLLVPCWNHALRNCHLQTKLDLRAL